MTHPPSPEPVVTASLYCSGLLDEVLLGFALPLRQGLRSLSSDSGPAELWAVRYSCGGEHLKIRIHADPAQKDAIGDLAERCARELLASLPEPDPTVPRIVRAKSPPIDEEDLAPEAPPDRSFCFTGYRISQISLGGEPYLDDDAYRAAMAAALCRNAETVLDDLEKTPRPLDHGRRQRILLRSIIGALASLGFDPTKAAAYLAYHRDWLLRTPLLRDGVEEDRAQTLLQDLVRKGERSAKTVAALRSALVLPQAGDPPPPSAIWNDRLDALRERVAELYDATDTRLDPFAPDPFFPALFKILHGQANLLGLKQLDEALTHHLLLLAAAPDLSPYEYLHLTPP